MSGNQTKDFDAVFQVGEPAIGEVVESAFVLHGVLCHIAGGLVANLAQAGGGSADGEAEDGDSMGLGDIIDPPGTVPSAVADAVATGAPRFRCFPDDLTQVITQFELPAGVTITTDTDTITVIGSVRSVADDAHVVLELVVALATMDLVGGRTVGIDFVGGLQHAEATLYLAGEEISYDADALDDALTALFEATVPHVGLVPVEQDPSTEDPMMVKGAEPFVIDDPDGLDRDALAVGLTFGGGTPGRAEDFLRSAIPEGRNAALIIGSPWLCRIVAQAVQSEFGMSATELSADGCEFEGSHEIDLDGTTATLRRIEFRVVDGRIDMTFHADGQKQCKEFEIQAGVSLTIDVSGETIDISADVHDPVVNTSTDGWCVLGAVLTGAIIGGLAGLFAGGPWGALVGALVGALAGLVVVAIVDLLFDPIGSVPDALGDAIGGAIDDLGDVTVPTIAVIPAEAWIDDVGIGFDTVVRLPYPVRSEGTAMLFDGQGLDLDRGAILPQEAGGVDLVATPVRQRYRQRIGGFTVVDVALWFAELGAVCGAAIGPTGRSELEHVNRLEASRLPLQVNGRVEPRQLTSLTDVQAVSQDPTRQVVAMRTNEGRYALLQVRSVDADHVEIDYLVWEEPGGAARIVGGFGCPLRVTPGTVTDWQVLPEAVAALASTPVAVPGLHERAPAVEAAPARRIRRHPGSGLVFEGRVVSRTSQTGHFEVLLDRPTPGAKAVWRLDGKPLTPESEVVHVDGVDIEYELEDGGRRLTLRMGERKEIDAWLEVDVETGAVPAHAATCLRWRDRCVRTTRRTPPLDVWMKLAPRHYAVVAVPDDPEAAAVTFGGAGPTVGTAP